MWMYQATTWNPMNPNSQARSKMMNSVQSIRSLLSNWKDKRERLLFRLPAWRKMHGFQLENMQAITAIASLQVIWKQAFTAHRRRPGRQLYADFTGA
jgi:hypothetical protein